VLLDAHHLAAREESIVQRIGWRWLHGVRGDVGLVR
jgi:hypothetical protein